MKYKSMGSLVTNWEERIDYEAQYLGESIVGELWRLMASSKVTKADLARRMKRSRPYVTRMFASGQNLTLRSIAGALAALDARLTVCGEALSEAERATMPCWHSVTTLGFEYSDALSVSGIAARALGEEWSGLFLTQDDMTPKDEAELLRGAA